MNIIYIVVIALLLASTFGFRTKTMTALAQDNAGFCVDASGNVSVDGAAGASFSTNVVADIQATVSALHSYGVSVTALVFFGVALPALAHIHATTEEMIHYNLEQLSNLGVQVGGLALAGVHSIAEVSAEFWAALVAEGILTTGLQGVVDGQVDVQAALAASGGVTGGFGSR